MKINSDLLIEDLIERTRSVLNHVQQMQEIQLENLNFKQDQQSWSALECIEHLNRYGDFYLPELQKVLSKAKKNDTNPIFRSGMLGNYFAMSMLPGEKMNKMKTFKDKDPSGSDLDLQTLDKFIGQQKHMLQLLNEARSVNLRKSKCAISITKWIKLRLGDTFRFVIFHNQRHMVQAWNVLDVAQNN